MASRNSKAENPLINLMEMLAAEVAATKENRSCTGENNLSLFRKALNLRWELSTRDSPLTTVLWISP